MRTFTYLACISATFFLSTASWAQTTPSEQIIAFYLTQVQPAFDKAEQDTKALIEAEQDPAQKTKLQKVFGQGLILPSDRAYIVQNLAAHLNRYLTPAEAQSVLTFIQSPAGQHFVAAQAQITSAVQPVVEKLVQHKLSLVENQQ